MAITKDQLLKALEERLSEVLSILPENLDEKAATLIELGIEEVSDLKNLSKKEIQDYLGVKPLQVTKVFNNFSKIDEAEETEVKADDIVIPTRPSELSAFESIPVTGNINIEPAVIDSYIEIALLKNLGIETITDTLYSLLKAKMEDFGATATAKILEAYRTSLMFKELQQPTVALLSDKHFLLPERERTISTINQVMFPAIIDFINDALQLRLEFSDFNSLVFKNIAKVKNVGKELNEMSVITAVEELATIINRDLGALHPETAKQTVVLYKKIFELINDKEIQTFLGATDARTMFQILGVTYSPKDVASFTGFPELVYGILSILKDDTILSSDKGIYLYLQKIWSNAKMIQWAKLGEVAIPRKQIEPTIEEKIQTALAKEKHVGIPNGQF